jgi:hypothetical protein
MTRTSGKKLTLIAIIMGLGLLAGLWILFFRPTDKAAPGPPAAISDAPVKGFTFLDLHADSVLTDRLKERLKETLGSEAVETKTVLDLEMHYPGFLERYFPDLDRLNKQLNYEGVRRVRIEHHITKLTYRYSTAFHYVELFFSNYDQKPLLFRIKAKRDGKDYLDMLRQKYGDPQTAAWQNQKGKSVFWNMNKDMMILSLFLDSTISRNLRS